MSTKSPEWKTMVVSPERLRSGLWGYKEGDISASYSADIYAEKKKLRRAFQFAHTPFVAMATQNLGFASIQAKAYPVYHSSSADRVMDDYRRCGLKDGYVGKPIKRGSIDCIFGLPVIFKQRDLRQHEIVDLCRRMYAYGGLFAAEAGTYDNLMLNWFTDHSDKRLRRAFMKELEAEDLPQSREGMRALVEGVDAPEERQMVLL